jgi:acetyltransferase-like isoleucine patch superfamily enzyme
LLVGCGAITEFQRTSLYRVTIMKKLLFYIFKNRSEGCASICLSSIFRMARNSVRNGCRIGKKNRLQGNQFDIFSQIKHFNKIKGCTLGKHSLISSCSTLDNVVLGNYSYLSDEAHLTNCTIGNFCSVGRNLRNGLGKHPVSEFVSTSPVFYAKCAPVKSFVVNNYFTETCKGNVIGNDVWIGDDVILMDGVIIGDGAIIGVRSVVTKDVSPFAIVGGVPAKLIRYRFPIDKIKELMNLRWWDKDASWIQANVDWFSKQRVKL